MPVVSPMLISGCEKRAWISAILRSQAQPSSAPPPELSPAMAAMLMTLSCVNSSIALNHPAPEPVLLQALYAVGQILQPGVLQPVPRQPRKPAPPPGRPLATLPQLMGDVIDRRPTDLVVALRVAESQHRDFVTGPIYCQ
jgi:hypothetical protein